MFKIGTSQMKINDVSRYTCWTWTSPHQENRDEINNFGIHTSLMFMGKVRMVSKYHPSGCSNQRCSLVDEPTNLIFRNVEMTCSENKCVEWLPACYDTKQMPHGLLVGTGTLHIFSSRQNIFLWQMCWWQLSIPKENITVNCQWHH